MRAILLAAGMGTRLRPLTDTVPKCLMPIAGRPLLQIWLEILVAEGVGPILINTHYRADQVEAYLAGSKFKDVITLSHEATLLGTAGTLVANRKFYCSEDGFLIHADNYCRPDLRGMVRTHESRPPECLMTMLTFRTEDPSSCGILETDTRGVVVGFHEKVQNPPGNLANGAVYLLSRTLIEMLDGELHSAKDFSTEILPRLVGRIATHETTGVFIDVGTPASYAKAVASAAREA